ncbi:hypothetical protein KIS1582_3847 [Cytobacillus firmus]|uniref:Group-specific protein n=2 Tax=Cytobacillus firmus TaxID=1399 RepID=A0A800MTS4_CYTFI|nr:hypothetical protein KIS1582_3847 [Cytobacillus firmus]
MINTNEKKYTVIQEVFLMSECKLDHTPEDVQKKFEQQRGFLPEDINPLFQSFFQQEHTQDILNEVFHLLKKFDLASEEERTERVNRLYLVLKNV